MEPKSLRTGGRHSRLYDDFTLRARKYREGARLLRSAAGMMSRCLANDLLEIAKELEEFADIIERLRFSDGRVAAGAAP
jgi:hypothetical protein